MNDVDMNNLTFFGYQCKYQDMCILHLSFRLLQLEMFLADPSSIYGRDQHKSLSRYNNVRLLKNK